MSLTFKEFLRGGKDQLAAAGFPEVDAEHRLSPWNFSNGFT
jgi:release factor glutamine methyltransferase